MCRLFENIGIICVLYLWVIGDFGNGVLPYSISEFHVGAVFTSNQAQHTIAFKRGIDEANRILEMNPNTIYRLKPLIMSLENINSFLVSQKTCNLLTKKVIAIIGPTDPIDSDQVQAVCNQFSIPFINNNPLSEYNSKQQLLIVSLYPHFNSLVTCLKDFIKKMDWVGSLVIIYTNNKDLVKYTELLNKFGNQVFLKKIIFDGSENSLIKYLRHNNYYHFIVDIPYWHFSTFMKLAGYYNMTNQFYSYLFANWDTQMLNLANFSFNPAVNITTLSLFPMQRQKTQDKNLQKFQKEIWEIEKLKHKSEIYTVLTTETAIIYESLRMLAYAIIDLSKLKPIHHLPSKLSCSSKDGWNTGVSLVNSFRNVNMKSALAGNGVLNVNSNRHIQISRLKESSYFKKYGYWTEKTGIVVTVPSMSKQEMSDEISKQNFKVVTIIDKPFVNVKKRDANGAPSKDIKDWEGFCVELLLMIQKELKFNFTIQVVEDGNYGSLVVNSKGEKYWNGLVGDLISHKADIALSSLTITYDRELVIDFTTPFMNLGISILYQTPKLKEIRLWAFLEPLSTTVWGYVIVSYISVSFILFVIGRLSPYEWYNPSPCQNNIQFNSNQFNILNSMWFTIGSFMQQGTDIVPKATSTRIVAGVWWFFTLIIISSYTANLAAFLTLARLKVPIENAEDLSKQNAINYGTVKGGSTFAFFEKSALAVYQKMYKKMKYNPKFMVTNNQEGIERISDNYAFILESTTNEYYSRRNCRLVRIGGLLDSKGYGIGLAEGSRYRDAFSEAILKLRRNQEIETLRRHYWRKYDNTAECPPPNDSARTTSLGLKETGGVFVMLFTGALSSVFVTIFEVFYKALKSKKVDKSILLKTVMTSSLANLRKICSTDDDEDDEEEEENTQVGESYNNGNQSNSSSPKRFRVGSMATNQNMQMKSVGDESNGISGPGCAALLDERDYFGSGPILPIGQSTTTLKSTLPPVQSMAQSSHPISRVHLPQSNYTNAPVDAGAGILSHTTSFDYATELGGGGVGSSAAMTLDSEPVHLHQYHGKYDDDDVTRPGSSPIHHLPPAISPAAKMIQSPIPLLNHTGGGPSGNTASIIPSYPGPGSQYTISPPASIIGVPIGPNYHYSQQPPPQQPPVFKDSHRPHHGSGRQFISPSIGSPPSYNEAHPYGDNTNPQQQQQQEVRVKKVAC